MWAALPGHRVTWPEFPRRRARDTARPVRAVAADRLRPEDFVLGILAHLDGPLIAVLTIVVALVIAVYVNRWQGSPIN
jgi:hypothetical protein